MIIRKKRYSILRPFVMWVISIAAYGIAVYLMWHSWADLMRNGEPIITSNMLLQDRNAISNLYRTRIMTGYTLLGFVAMIFYWTLWTLNGLPASEKELAIFAKRFSGLYLWGIAGLLVLYSQKCFTIPQLKPYLAWLDPTWIAPIVIVLQILVLLINRRPFGLSKAKSNLHTRWFICSGTILIIMDVIVILDIPAVLKLLSKLFELGDIFQKVFNIVTNLMMDTILVPEPFVVRTVYDGTIAIGLPLLLYLLLFLNTKFNAHYRIGVPHDMLSSESNMYTFVRMKRGKEQQE